MAAVVENNLSDISKKLDDLALEILSVMQTIILERQYIDNNLKDGFINLAKSRYLMRGQQINTLQINSANLHSTKRVIRNFETVNGVEFDSFHISNAVKGNECVGDESQISDGLRKLKIKKSEDDDTKKDLCEEHKTCPDNPLHWFGVLVPSALKDCQSRFDQVIETSMKLVTLQNQLEALSKEYTTLRLEKSKCDRN